MTTETNDDHTTGAVPVGAPPLDRRRFIRAAGASAGAAALTAALPVGRASAAVPAGASSFVPLAKAVRLADTRDPGKYSATLTRLGATSLRVRVRDTAGVPPDATAVVLTVTGKNFQTVNNYITVYPTGTKVPVASNLNLPRPGELNANLVFVKVGTKHSVDIFQFAPCETIVDVLGYFTPTSSAVRAGRFKSLATAWRALDTRQRANHFVTSGSYTEVDVTDRIPPSAASVMINLTSLANPGWGFFSAVPYSVTGVPTTSSLNVVFPNDKRAAAVIVPVETVGGRRKFKVYSSGPAKLIVDVTGYFTNETVDDESTDGLFVPTEPTRVLDTRTPAPGKKMWAGWVIEQKLAAPAATSAAVVMNVTSARTLGEGYLTVSGARRAIPATSNLNWTGPGAIVPNLAVSPVTSYGFQVFNFSGGHVIADLAGYFTGKPSPPTYGAPYSNPAPQAVGPEWTLRIPRLGLTQRVMDGDAIAVTDAGHTWHWAGTGWMGQNAHVSVFGHRTEPAKYTGVDPTGGVNGPYRYLHLLQDGDTWTVTTRDGREFTYRMVGRDLTDDQNGNILDATRSRPGTTFSIIACTRGYDSSGYRRYLQWYEPTSLRYRLIVTGVLVGWREVF